MPFDQLTQSPRTQAAQGMQQGGGDADDFFREGFAQMAYGALQKSNPDLVAEVVTFRILETDPDSGAGVGAFILAHGGDIVYVPVVVSDNNVKPLDVFYSRRLDRYYPLTKEWLQESSRNALNSLGEGVKPPKTLPTDVDIRNLVVPPTTGRYSYAAAADGPALPALLGAAPNAVKTAFARVLRKHPGLLKTAAAVYGATALTEALALRSEKKAALREERPLRHDVFVASLSTPLQYLKDELDPAEVGKAYAALRTYGFYAKDRRKATDKLMVMEEGDVGLAEPKSPGLYVVHLADGTAETALVVPNPLCTGENRTDEGKARSHDGVYGDRVWSRSRVLPCRYVVLFKDGRYAEVRGDLVAEPVVTADHDDVLDFLKGAKERPANGERGALVCGASNAVRATAPMQASEISDTADQTSFVADWGDRVILSKRIDGNRVMRPAGEAVLVLSKNYRWWPCTKRLSESELLRTPKSVLLAWKNRMLREGAKPLAVKRASHGFYVGADRAELPLHKAVEKVARDWNVSVPEAIEFVKRAALRRAYAGWVVKRAADDKKKAPGGGEEPSPEEQMAMQQQMAAAQQPPPPTGLDLAVAEQMQQIQMQIQSLQDKANALQMVQQRAMQIDSGGGAAAAPMGAAAMMGGPAPAMPGMPPQDPAMGGMPMDPAMGAPPGSQQMPGGVQGGPGGMPLDPAQGGMDPNAMAAQGMDPAMMQAPPPPQAVMTEDLSPDNIEAQINPQFLEQAGALEQGDVFDAAAVASLASQKNLRELTQAYVPGLERTLDNLGRILVLFDLREADIKEQAGNELYAETEENVRDVFRGLGDLLLKINQNAQPLLPQGGRSG